MCNIYGDILYLSVITVIYCCRSPHGERGLKYRVQLLSRTRRLSSFLRQSMYQSIVNESSFNILIGLKKSIFSNYVIRAKLRKFILIFPLNCCIIHEYSSIGVSPRGKAQDFDSCITMVRIHLPQPRKNALTLFASAFFSAIVIKQGRGKRARFQRRKRQNLQF